MGAGPLLMLNSERTWRGGESQLALLVRGLAPHHPVVTVCQPASPLAAELRRHGAAVEELAMRGGADLLAAWRLRRLVRRLRPAALHAHTPHAHALALLAVVGLDVPVLVTRRVDFRVRAGRYRKYGPRVRQFIAVSQAIAGVLADGGIDPGRIAVIRDGVDPARLVDGPRSLRAELGLADDAVLVGCVAHLADHKDHRTLLAAWAQVEAAAPLAHLAIVGDGELAVPLRAQAADLGLRRVHFTGFRADIPAVLRSLDVFALTSHLEGLGSSVADAMLRALPVVATRAGGLPELVEDGVTGLLAGVRDVPAVAAALAALVRPDAAALRARLGVAGKARAERTFTAARMVEEHVALYRRLLGEEVCHDCG